MINNAYAYKQKVIDKQKQSLHYSYETLCHLLSAAENFAGLRNEQYKGYNISISTNYEELKSEFAWELHCFQLSKKMYEKKYGEYIYPNELPKEKILLDIKRYMERVNEKDKILYYAMINVIDGGKIDLNFDELFEELEKAPNKKFNPSMMANLIGPINQILNKIEKNVEEGKFKYEVRKNKSKSLEKLIKTSQYNMNNYINGIIGQRGNLQKLNNLETFIFEKYRGNKKDYITLKNPLQNGKKLYECIINANQMYKEGYLYFFNEFPQKTVIFYCTLFEKDINFIQSIKEQQFNYIDEKNKYGRAFVQNNEFDFLLLDQRNSHIDMEDYK